MTSWIFIKQAVGNIKKLGLSINHITVVKWVEITQKNFCKIFLVPECLLGLKLSYETCT